MGKASKGFVIRIWIERMSGEVVPSDSIPMTKAAAETYRGRFASTPAGRSMDSEVVAVGAAVGLSPAAIREAHRLAAIEAYKTSYSTAKHAFVAGPARRRPRKAA